MNSHITYVELSYGIMHFLCKNFITAKQISENISLGPFWAHFQAIYDF